MPKRQQESLQTAAKHVTYELEMLVFAAGKVGGWHASPITPVSGNSENMALESFLLHFRNLRGFLCPTLQDTRAGDILAGDFLGWETVHDIVDKRKIWFDKERLDKMLAHLSYARERFIEARKYGWEVATMLVATLEQIEDFFALLQPDVRSWFPSAKWISDEKVRANAGRLISSASSSTTCVVTTNIGPTKKA